MKNLYVNVVNKNVTNDLQTRNVKLKKEYSKQINVGKKYSNIDYELVLFISRYYDQLPLCSNCRNYFVTHRTQFLAEDPRASLDYAADVVLHSPTNEAMTMKQAAKARLIQDYDKQSDILFNLCDTCLNKCEQIRNELKQINFARKMVNESDSPTIDMMTMEIPELQQQQLFTSPSLSPSASDVQDHLFSPTISSPIPPSPLNLNLVHQQKTILTPPTKYHHRFNMTFPTYCMTIFVSLFPRSQSYLYE